jgi:hypothetical protein
MAKKKPKSLTKPLFAPPDIERDRKELAEFYRKYLDSEDDFEGLGPADIRKLSELAQVLKDLKRR